MRNFVSRLSRLRIADVAASKIAPATGTVKLATVGVYGSISGMSTTSNPYRGFRFPAEIINQSVWLYHCFSLSLREVELILAARGIVVSYETIREWSLRFGRTYAKTLVNRLPSLTLDQHPILTLRA
jgi:putative transposase